MKFTTLLATLLLIAPITAQAAEKPPFNTVQEVFVGLSDYDVEKIRSHVTSDFELLEVGEVWDMKILEDILSSGTKPIRRRNFFSIISEVHHGDVVWISYWNRAEYTREEGLSERAWLESAILVKEQEVWKLQMLHSTRIEVEQLPEDVTLKEFVSGE